MIEIDEKEWKEIQKQLRWLACLECAGVDNWEGISYAYELLKKPDEEW